MRLFLVGLTLFLITCTSPHSENTSRVNEAKENLSDDFQGQEVSTQSNGSPVKAQKELNFSWEKTYGGSKNDRMQILAATPDGGALLGGISSFQDLITFEINYDIYLVRIDARGNTVWEKTFDGPHIEMINDLALASDGGALLGGYAERSGDKNGDMYLTRIDAFGAKLWEQTYGGAKADSIESLALTSDGGALLGGFTESLGAGKRDIYLVKIDSEGKKLWEKTYGGAENDDISSLALTHDGGAFLGGTTNSKGAGQNDMYLVRVDSQGNLLWEKTFGGIEWDAINSLKSTPDGGALFGGNTASEDPEGDLYLGRVDSDGNMLWDQTYGEDGFETINSLILTADGGALLGIESNSIFDMVLLSVDADGNKNWQKTFGGTAVEWVQTMVETADGGILMGGTRNPRNNESVDLYLVRAD